MTKPDVDLVTMENQPWVTFGLQNDSEMSSPKEPMVSQQADRAGRTHHDGHVGYPWPRQEQV